MKQAFAAEAAGTAEAFYATPEFWVAVAFVLLVGGVAKPLYRIVTTALDARAEGIRNRIDEAERLKEDAAKMKADFERKQREAADEAEQIIGRAREEAERVAARAKEDLAASLQRRERQALDRIAQAEAAALDEVRAQAVDVAVDATRRLLAENVTAQKANDMIDNAIKELPDKLH